MLHTEQEMNRIEELTGAIEGLDSQIKELECKRNSLAQERAELLCPFKVGDKVKRKQGSFLITVIADYIYRPNDKWALGYIMHGRWLKKDGTVSNRPASTFKEWRDGPFV